MSNIDDNFLEAKKNEFITFVEEACRFFNLDKCPKIEFVEGYVSHGMKALAEIDYINWIMYVSLVHLKDMPQHEMKKTAFHEVTHLLVNEHNPKFYKKLDEAISTTWTPENPSGITMRTGNTGFTNVDKTKSEPEEIDTVRCNYHLHREEAELTQCQYCKKYYCELHIRPKKPHFFNPNEPDHDYFGHPCIHFDLYLKEDIEIKSKYDMEYKRIIEFRQYAEQIYKKQNHDNSVNIVNSKKIYQDMEAIVNVHCFVCLKDGVGLTRCIYCKEWFCKKHSEPNFLGANGGHFCKSFTEQQKEQIPLEKNSTKEKKTFWERLRGK